MSEPSGGRATPVPTAMVSGHPWPVYGSQLAPHSRPGSPREMSRYSFSCCREKWGCREAPLKSSRRQTPARAGGRRGRSARFGGGSPDSAGGSRVRPRARGNGAWMGQHLGRVHACLTTAGAARRDETSTPRRRSHPGRILVKRQPVEAHADGVGETGIYGDPADRLARAGTGGSVPVQHTFFRSSSFQWKAAHHRLTAGWFSAAETLGQYGRWQVF